MILVCTLIDDATVIGSGEVGNRSSCRQVGVVLDGVGITPTVLQCNGRLCSHYRPAGTVKGKGVVLIQGVLAVVGKAEDCALGQYIGLTGFKSAIEMEGQHDGAAHIFHTNPAKLLILVGRLVNGAAVVAGSKVDTRCVCRQVGIDLNQVACAVTVLEAQSTGAVFCHAGKDLCRIKIVLGGNQQVL